MYERLKDLSIQFVDRSTSLNLLGAHPGSDPIYGSTKFLSGKRIGKNLNALSNFSPRGISLIDLCPHLQTIDVTNNRNGCR